MDKLKIGDVVRLNSGSPPMTVIKVLDTEMVLCNWFVKPHAKCHEGRFPLVSLQDARIVPLDFISVPPKTTKT